jgi:hypothetical protein
LRVPLTDQDVTEIRRLAEESGRQDVGYLVKGVAGQREIAPLHKAGTFFEGVPEDQVCSNDLYPADRVEINSLSRLFITTQQPGMGTT